MRTAIVPSVSHLSSLPKLLVEESKVAHLLAPQISHVDIVLYIYILTYSIIGLVKFMIYICIYIDVDTYIQ